MKDSHSENYSNDKCYVCDSLNERDGTTGRHDDCFIHQWSGYLKLFEKEVDPLWIFESVGRGWHQLVSSLISELKQLGWDGDIHQIKEKFGCYDEKTRVLTKNGFKFFKEISFDDEIATLKEGKYLEYNKPSDIISYHYEGDMYRLKTRGVDLLVTPNHNLYVAKGSYYNGKYSPPKKIDHDFELTTYQKYFGKNKRFLKGCEWIGKEKETFFLPKMKISWNNIPTSLREKTWEEKAIPMNSWLQLLGWYVAEGSSCHGCQSTFSVCYLDDKNELPVISEIIKSCGFNPKFNENTENSAINVLIYEKRLTQWLIENCGHLAPNKSVPSFVKDLSKNQIKIFLESLFQGDGCKQKTSHILTTVSKQLCDDVCELIFKCGDTFSFWSREPSQSELINGVHKSYEINWLKSSNDHNTSNKGMAKSSIEQMEKYNGNVYCVTVPNNVIFVERGGKGVWCGNSLRFYIGNGSEEIFDLIWEYEGNSRLLCEYCGKSGKTDGWGSYWIKTLCDEHGEQYRNGELNI